MSLYSICFRSRVTDRVCAHYLLDSLGCDNGGDCASLLHHHSLLMTRIHRLAMQVAGCGFSVGLQKHKVQSDHSYSRHSDFKLITVCLVSVAVYFALYSFQLKF